MNEELIRSLRLAAAFVFLAVVGLCVVYPDLGACAPYLKVIF